MSVFLVMVSGPRDTQREREACCSVIDVAGRLLREVDHKTAVIPVDWEKDVVVQTTERNQQAINDQLLGKADCVVAVFRTWFGSPTGEADSGTEEEIHQALRQGKPCRVYFYCGARTDCELDHLDQLHKLQAFKQHLEEDRLTCSYTSLDELQFDLLQWLFKLFYRERRTPSNRRQKEFNELVRTSDFMAEPAVKRVAGILYTIAGGRARAIATLQDSGGLAEYVRIHGWRMEIRDDENMLEVRRDYARERSFHAWWNELPLNDADIIPHTGMMAYVLFDLSDRVVYLNEPLRAKLDEVLRRLAGSHNAAASFENKP